MEVQPEENHSSLPLAPYALRTNAAALNEADTELNHLSIQLELIRRALTAIVTGQEIRGLLCHGVSALFDATGAAHVSVELAMNRSELYQWRRDLAHTESHVLFSIKEQGLEPVPVSSRWYVSAARRSILGWIDRPYLAELPLVVNAERLCILVIGRTSPFDSTDEIHLANVASQLTAIERIRQRLPPNNHPGNAKNPRLTSREVDVLLLLRQGLLARAIATRLDVSDRTVHKHLGSIYTKLGVHDRMMAVKRAEDLGLTDIQTRPRSETA